MGVSKKIMCLLLMVAFLLPVGIVSAEVSWTGLITDAEGDVEKNFEENVTGWPGIDILRVTMTDEGDTVNLTMVLAGKYNSTASFGVYLKVDGESGWSFSKVILFGFMATDPDGESIDIEGNISEDGTEIYWEVAKSEINATQSVKLEYADSNLIDFGTFDIYSDKASPGGGPVPPLDSDIAFKSVSMVMDFEEVARLRMTVEMVFDADSSELVRLAMDTNSDGTVSAAEVSAYVGTIKTGDTENNLTLDGKKATSSDNDTSIEGAEGPTDSDSELKMVNVFTTIYPEPEEREAHTYAWPEREDDILMAGNEPWGDQAEYHLRIVCPDGWRFDTGDWPSNLLDLLNSDGTELEMDDSQIREGFNSTLGQLDSLIIQKEQSGDNGDGDDDSPGFSLLVALIAVGVSGALIDSRRER